MAKPIKFSSIQKEKILIKNRCSLCRKIIPKEKVICSSCKKKQIDFFNRKR